MRTPDQTDPWEDEFRKRFEHFNAEPPADALARILMQANAPVPPPPTGRRWWKYGTMALIGLLLSVTGYLALDKQDAPVVTQIRPGNGEYAETVVVAGKKKGRTLTASARQNRNATEKEGRQSITDKAPESAALSTVETDADSPEAEHTVRNGKRSAVAGYKPATNPRTSLPGSSAVAGSPVTATAGRKENILDHQLVTRKYRAGKRHSGPDRNNTLPVTAAADFTDQRPFLPDNARSPIEAIAWRNPAVAVTMLSGKGFQISKRMVQLPRLQASVSAEPAQSKPRQRPVWFVSFMPWYTFRQISPNTTDDVYIRQIKTDNGLSGDRVGWRMQAGGEWRLTNRVSLRLGLNYGQFRQTVQYSVGAAKPDSVTVSLIDDRTLQLTPVSRDIVKTQTTNWQYAGISADAVWHLGAGKHWTYYATTGASVGGYIGPIRRFSGFYQGSFGVERPLTNSLWLRVEPTVQYGWNAVSDHKSLFLIRPYMYGLNVSLRY
ncbi:hypothetical protein [Arsenicibacter rosenii]|uniref:Outer membrane protein beta-barrel domain-containing protein n=1 Tax=Arsenicibacter rosenii TaxID=1750698 RepID=A0A1S2VMS7_9BACT|nr:hypothetical protein [Arsenicibacter rosenii]OIN60082.1 hypothetical protein BLX24_04325 [Arsenicibacter rosenii]